MKFSIIIPMFNAASFVERVLMSVFEQDIDDTLIEILLINDGSPDNSEELAREISKARKNVKIFSQKNKGLGGARNTGIDHALGEYIIFLDADDYLEPNCLSIINEKISNPNFKNIDLFELGCKSVSEDFTILSEFIPKQPEKILTGIEYYLEMNSINSACNKIYRRESLANLRFKEKIYSEDSEFNTRTFFLFKSVCSLNLVLQSFVQTTGSITRNKNNRTKNKLIQDHLAVFKFTRYFENEYSSKSYLEKKYFEKKYTLFTVNIFYLLLKYRMSISKAIEVKKILKSQNLLTLSYSKLEKKRDKFRKFLMYAFPFYLLILGIRNKSI